MWLWMKKKIVETMNRNRLNSIIRESIQMVLCEGVKRKRRVVSANGLYDVISDIPQGKMVTVCYLTAADLNYPMVKRKNPETNRMKGYPDFETFGKSMGYEGEKGIGGVVCLTLLKSMNWNTAKDLEDKYRKYRQKKDDIRVKYGLEPVNKDSVAGKYKKDIDYGNGGISVYGGENAEKSQHSYVNANTYYAKRDPYYYLVDVDGNIIREVTESELKPYFKPFPKKEGVSALEKMQVDQSRIEEYIKELDSLHFTYRTFEASSILSIVATLQDRSESVVFRNDKLNPEPKGVKINVQQFLSMVDDRYEDQIIGEQEKEIFSFDRI